MKQKADPMRPAEKKRILVIDDQAEVVELIGYVLTGAGFEVVEARSGREGLERARLFRPHVILCDIMMPGMNGHEVLEAVRRDALLAPTPFIFLTAKASPADLRTGMDLGADDYLIKPFLPAELIAAIRARIEKYETAFDRFEQKLDLLRQGISTVLPHELRTPLSLILAHAGFVLEAYDALDRDAVLDSVRVIHESGQRLHRLIENLLIYVELEGDATLRIEHPRTEDVVGLVNEAAESIAAVYGRSQDLRVEGAALSMPVHAVHLRKIAEELVDNAFKYSAAGSEVRVTLGQRDGHAVLEVEDRGRGMTAEEVERLDAYVQYGRSHFEQQGSGLGLVVARRIARLYQGNVEIGSSPQAGTRVTVRLPAGG